jgi:hypothetical protein
MSKSIETPIDKEHFEIRYVFTPYPHAAITYKGLPLWETTSPDLEEYKFFLLDESMFNYGFLTLTCRDEHGDLYVYGRWETLEQAQEWLEKPVRLY